MNLLLIGYRGSGKTTVAAALSGRLGWDWIDADAELERRAGRTIKHIFAEGGETEFRDLESAVLTDLVGLDHNVIALGGGVILREQNRRLLVGRGKVVWLIASPETLLSRLSADPTTADRRPNLTAAGGLDEIRELLARRTPLYAACADLAVDAENGSPDELADQIITRLKLQDTA